MNSDILNELWNRLPAGTLYHYTTQAGLLGIFKDKEIWATHTQYLNDRREFRHATEMMRQIVGSLLKNVSNEESPPRIDALRMIQRTLEGSHEGVNVCVCSFSENEDSLSQWRAYGGASGFAIGFDGKRLKEWAETPAAETGRPEWVLTPCIYDQAQQERVLRDMIEEVVDEMLSGGSESLEPFGDLDNTGGKSKVLLRYLYRYAPILKDKSFEEEQEWRLISAPLSCTRPRFDHRLGKSTIVPFYRFSLGDGSTFPLKEVKIGPTPNEERSNSALASFLFKCNIPFKDWNPPISHSKVPFRDW